MLCFTYFMQINNSEDDGNKAARCQLAYQGHSQKFVLGV